MTQLDVAPQQVAATNPGWVGNPAIIGLPGFAIGSIGLGLQQVGYVSAGAVGAVLPLLLAASGLLTFVAALWATRLGQDAVAAIFGIFSAFWWSYSILVLGLLHNWFALPPEDVVHVQALFLGSWLVVVAALTLGTLRMPAAFTLTFALVDLCLVLNLIATLNASPNMGKAAGVAALAFGAVGVYLLIGALMQSTGGKGLPAGRPVVA